MAIEVMLDIFSGLPNPVWELSSAEETELLARLETLPPRYEEVLPEPPGLGYRGFVIRPAGCPKLQGPVTVYKGAVRYADEGYKDVQRELEKWLLNKAGSTLPNHLKEVVKREVEKA